MTAPEAVSDVPSCQWQPLLENEDRALAEHAILDIAAALWHPPSGDVSLSGGVAGIALFFAYLAQGQSGSEERFVARSVELIDSAVDAVASTFHVPAFFSGFPGIAWAVEHIQRIHPSAFPDDDLNGDIDAALVSFTQKSPWRADYDLIKGLVGLGIYALERPPSENRERLLRNIVERLSETAVNDERGTAWMTAPLLLPDWQREMYPNGYFNLGLSHGAPGVIVLLARLVSLGIAADESRAMLVPAVRWMLSLRVERGDAFPSFVDLDGTPGPGRRAAWCYGNLSVATALISAGLLCSDDEWLHEGISLAQNVTALTIEAFGIHDGGLCHGAAGIAHLFNRMYQATRIEAFRDASVHAFRHLLSIRVPGLDVAGFPAWDVTEQKWHPVAGLLGGAAGVGLALMSAVWPVEPTWDRALLTELPVG